MRYPTGTNVAKKYDDPISGKPRHLIGKVTAYKQPGVYSISFSGDAEEELTENELKPLVKFYIKIKREANRSRELRARRRGAKKSATDAQRSRSVGASASNLDNEEEERGSDDDHLANDDGAQPHNVGGEGELAVNYDLGVGGDGTKSSNNHFPYEPAAEETKEEYFSNDEDSDDDQQHSVFNTDLGDIESAGYGSNDEGSVDTSANEKELQTKKDDTNQGALRKAANESATDAQPGR